MGALISLLVAIGIIFLIVWAVRSLMRAFGIGEPIATVVNVVIVVVVVLIVASWLLHGGIGSLGSLKL